MRRPDADDDTSHCLRVCVHCGICSSLHTGTPPASPFKELQVPAFTLRMTTRRQPPVLQTAEVCSTESF